MTDVYFFLRVDPLFPLSRADIPVSQPTTLRLTSILHYHALRRARHRSLWKYFSQNILALEKYLEDVYGIFPGEYSPGDALSLEYSRLASLQSWYCIIDRGLLFHCKILTGFIIRARYAERVKKYEGVG